MSVTIVKSCNCGGKVVSERGERGEHWKCDCPWPEIKLMPLPDEWPGNLQPSTPVAQVGEQSKEWMTRGIVDEHGINPHIRITPQERADIIDALGVKVELPSGNWWTVMDADGYWYVGVGIDNLKQLDALREQNRQLSKVNKKLKEQNTNIIFSVARKLRAALATKPTPKP